MEQYFQGAALHGDIWKSVNSTLDDEPKTNPSNGFECNICLDLVRDPVVTFCGHLYCWPCIYRWISFQENPDHHQKLPQCPVCKSDISEKTLIPLYGRGHPISSSKHHIPQRPRSPRFGPGNTTATNHSLHRSYAQPSRPYHGDNYMASPMLGLGGSTSNLVDPMIGIFGEMVYARIFGNPETPLYAYPNSYDLAGSTSPRLRRYMMQTDKSLSRVCFFLCCCVMLCLLLF